LNFQTIITLELRFNPSHAILSKKFGTIMDNQEKIEGTLLTITAEIISNLNEGYIIKLYNDETDEATTVSNVDEYADYIISSVNNSKCADFKAVWVPSPNAKRADIDQIGITLGEIQQRFDIEIGAEEG
jgi:hypothetical protein